MSTLLIRDGNLVLRSVGAETHWLLIEEAVIGPGGEDPVDPVEPDAHDVPAAPTGSLGFGRYGHGHSLRDIQRINENRRKRRQAEVIAAALLLMSE